MRVLLLSGAMFTTVGTSPVLLKKAKILSPFGKLAMALIFEVKNKKNTMQIKCTVFTLSIGMPYLLTILILKFEIVHSTTS